jgi:hypothetical protein
LPSCREIIDAMIWKEASMEGKVIVSDYYLIVIPFVAPSRQHLTSPGNLARLVGSGEPINYVLPPSINRCPNVHQIQIYLNIFMY